MSVTLAAPLVEIAVLATIGQRHSTKLATFTESAWLQATDAADRPHHADPSEALRDGTLG
jgi:hypothetical protein